MSQTLPTTPLLTTPESEPPPNASLWRVTGALILAHVVLLVVGITLQDSPRFEEGTLGIQRGYVEGDLARTMAGVMVEALGFLLMIPTLVFLARALGRRTEVGHWAAQTALLAGALYIGVTMAVGFPAGAAAAYGAQHGLDVDAAFAVNNVRIFGYFLSLSLLGVHALGVAVAARQDGVLTRWVGVGGLVTGVALLASVPAATVGQQDWGTLVWLVWWVGVGICLFRQVGVRHPLR